MGIMHYLYNELPISASGFFLNYLIIQSIWFIGVRIMLVLCYVSPECGHTNILGIMQYDVLT